LIAGIIETLDKMDVAQPRLSVKTDKRKNQANSTIPASKKQKPAYTEGLDGTKNYVVYKKIDNYKPSWKIVTNFTEPSTVIYFKFDLRTLDNPALFHGCEYAKEKTDQRFIGLYVFCIKELKVHEYSDSKILLIYETLTNLQLKLKKEYNMCMHILVENEPAFVPYAVQEFCKQVKCEALFHNRMYENDEAKRDSIMESLLKSDGISCTSYEDQCVVPVQTLKSGKDKDYMVFTPYKKAWLAAIEKNPKYLDIYDLKSYFQSSDITVKV
jgi:deoxyribodipyrimidine photolyase